MKNKSILFLTLALIALTTVNETHSWGGRGYGAGVGLGVATGAALSAATAPRYPDGSRSDFCYYNPGHPDCDQR